MNVMDHQIILLKRVLRYYLQFFLLASAETQASEFPTGQAKNGGDVPQTEVGKNTKNYFYQEPVFLQIFNLFWCYSFVIKINQF